MRRATVDALFWLEQFFARLKIRVAKPIMPKLAAQAAIILCYICTLCGERKAILEAGDVHWIHYCKRVPKGKA